MDWLAREDRSLAYSPIKVFMGEVRSSEGREGFGIAEKLMDLYVFHQEFQVPEYTAACNQLWNDE